VLALLEQAFNGNPELLGDATRTMFAVKAQAEALMQMPDGPGRTAGPSFGYVPPELRHSAVEPSVAAPGIGSAFHDSSGR
jgi:hypothetical protein